MNDVTGNEKNPLNLIWIDLEMTGLNTENDVIIEIATIVTDKDLNILGEGPILAIHQPEALLEGMDEWNTRQHGGSGLTDRVRSSTTSLAEAEQATIKFLEQFVDAKTSPMCGNSICQDRRFMARQMPALEAFFHYRNLDVSSVKEIAKRWRPEVLKGIKKQGSHLAMDDIKDSIAELSHYREVFFNEAEAES
ncbi:MAG: oligoribonuclease [Porticoccus sp.]|nr:oligoribonuclease [Porticoccus sp.]